MSVIAAETKRINVGDREVEVEVYAPETDEARPGILVLHEIFGMRDWYRRDAQDLAERGYLVYLPNLYTGGTMRYCIRAMITEATNPSTSSTNQEIHKLLDALKADDRCNGSMGMIGMCLTGGFVLQMAKRPDMKAPVVYHHSLGRKGAGIPRDENFDDVERMQGHFAKTDVFCPAARRAKLREQLGDRLEYFEYDMAHGFRSLSRDKPEAPLVWERTLSFFEQHLG